MRHPAGPESAETKSVSEVDDSEPLLRLLWAEHDVRDGKILPEAIPTSDLRGPDRGFSVDRELLARREIMETPVEYQRPRAKKPEDRQTPFLSRIASAKDVRELKDSNGEKPFLVDPSPTPATDRLPANLAHAEIKSAEKCSSKARQIERRQLLRSVLGPPVMFADFWAVDR
ncbi:MAG: hypothetical protein ACRECP_05025 [Methylocella sp.]